MSRKLDRERSEANALRTLDERRAAQTARETNNTPRPAPGTDIGQSGGYADNRRAAPAQGYGYGPAPAQPPIIINNNGGSGLGNVVAGAIIARSMTNAHANNNGGNNGGYYPPPNGSAGGLATQAGANSVGGGSGTAAAAPAASGSVFGAIVRTIVWLGVLALLGWGIWFIVKRRKARRDAGKPNYSFERN